MKTKMRFYSLTVLALLSILFATTLTAFAQAEEQTSYKVGDRVEVDPQASALTYKFKTWHKATVTKIGPVGGGVHGYYVRVDAEGDSGPTDNYVMTGSNMIRPLQEAEKTEVAKGGGEQEKKAEPGNEPKVAAANTCPPANDVKGKTQTDIFKALIAEQYEHKSKSEQDPTTTIAFQTFKIGAPHSWRPGVGGQSPDGGGGRAGTTVYPVKALFTMCTDVPAYKPSGFRGWIMSHQDDAIFYCLKNQFGEWQCNSAGAQKTDEKYTNK